PLLGADPRRALRVPLVREPPERGPRDEEERAADRAGRQRRRMHAALREHEDRTGGGERRPEDRAGRVGVEPTAPPDEDEPAGDERDPEDDAIREPEGAEDEHGGGDAERTDDPGAVAPVGGPEGQVEQDPGPAREREQGEDQPDERRVDAERPGDPGADAREDARVGITPEARQRHRGSSYGAVDRDLAEPCPHVEDEDAAARCPDR